MLKKSASILFLICFAAWPLACDTSNIPSGPASPAGGGQFLTPTPSFTNTYSFVGVFGSSGTTVMSFPSGLCVSGSDLWVVNQDPVTSNLEEWTTAGGAAAGIYSYNSTVFNLPRGVAVGPDGYLYVADGNKLIVELDPSGAYVTTFGQAELGTDDTDGVAVGSSKAYVLDDTTPSVLVYTLGGSGASKTFSASATFGTASLGILPKGIALDASGDVYVADQSNRRIVKFNSAGVSQLAVTLVSSGIPAGAVVDGSGNLFAADGVNHEIQVFDPSGAAATQFGASNLVDPSAIALDAAGNVYVADYAVSQVAVFKKN